MKEGVEQRKVVLQSLTVTLVMLIAAAGTTARAEDVLPAFPGAEGFGATIETKMGNDNDRDNDQDKDGFPNPPSPSLWRPSGFSYDNDL